MIELQFMGAADTVTGSKHVLRTSRATVLLDCGLFQGRRQEGFDRNRAMPVDVAKLDAVVLSHPHLDHSGALPMLVKHGYDGPIYATHATRDLCAPMLADSARIQASDARHIARLIERGVDLQPVEPLYDEDDVVGVLERIIGIPYRRRQRIAPGVNLTFLDAGHVLGSAVVILDIDDEGSHVRLAFTGDLGRPGSPILREADTPDGVNCLITEATYGDRNHPDSREALDQLAAAIRKTVDRGGKIIIPAFALERAQEVIYSLQQLRRAGTLPHVPVYVDSPLTIQVTDVYRLHPECFRKGAFPSGDPYFEFDNLTYVSDVEASKAIDAEPGPSIIIAGSGMCEGGRVLHHLRAFIEDPRTTIIIVGFMAEHTLGRRLVERRPEVRIFGVMRPRHAEVVTIEGLSAHADRDRLVEYAEAVRDRGQLRNVIIVHGEAHARESLRAELVKRDFPSVATPVQGETIRL